MGCGLSEFRFFSKVRELSPGLQSLATRFNKIMGFGLGFGRLQAASILFAKSTFFTVPEWFACRKISDARSLFLGTPEAMDVRATSELELGEDLEGDSVLGFGGIISIIAAYLSKSAFIAKNLSRSW